MKKILVPTDFSENAYNALKYGVHLFAEEDCTFYLLYTYTPALYNAEYMVSSNLSIDEIYRRNSIKSITKIVKRIKNESPNEKHHFKKIASFNLLQEEIINQVKTLGIDLIVMGTQGATGAAQILLGTHTINAIKRAICPLLAIPADYEFTTPNKILFSTDYESDITEEHLNILKQIANIHKSKIHILHVKQDVPLDPEQKKNKKALKEYLNDHIDGFHTIEKETVAQGIYHFQKENSIDLLVMAKFKHSFFYNLFFSSVVKKIGFRLTTPFLVIPVRNKSKNKSFENDSSTHRFFE